MAASIVDSRRTVITHEELREQGELVIMFGRTLELLHFVRGGTKFMDTRSFSRRFGSLEINGDEFRIPEVGAVGKVTRVEDDWGWEFVCTMGCVRFASFDRVKGFAAHEGALGRSPDGEKWVPHPVQGQLIHSDPAFGLYTHCTV